MSVGVLITWYLQRSANTIYCLPVIVQTQCHQHHLYPTAENCSRFTSGSVKRWTYKYKWLSHLCYCGAVNLWHVHDRMYKLLSVIAEGNNSVYKHTESLSQKDLKETAQVSIWTRPLVLSSDRPTKDTGQ